MYGRKRRELAGNHSRSRNYFNIKGECSMKMYKITAFEANGEKILDETFQAENDEEAKKLGEKLLSEKSLLNKTHRCTSPSGKLLLFHS
jgi:hypothetical protein